MGLALSELVIVIPAKGFDLLEEVELGEVLEQFLDEGRID